MDLRRRHDSGKLGGTQEAATTTIMERNHYRNVLLRKSHGQTDGSRKGGKVGTQEPGQRRKGGGKEIAADRVLLPNTKRCSQIAAVRQESSNPLTQRWGREGAVAGVCRIKAVGQRVDTSN